MRARPDNFVFALRIQWLCAALDRLLGQTDLSMAPVLMSGFQSVLDHPGVKKFAQAAVALRQLGVSLASEIQVRQAVLDALLWQEENQDKPDYSEPPYEVRPEADGYPFRRRAGSDLVVDAMVRTLMTGLKHEAWNNVTADVRRPMAVLDSFMDGASRIDLEIPANHLIPPMPQHSFQRKPRGPINVPMRDLESLAKDLDRIDDQNPSRPKGNWYARLREANGNPKFQILSPSSTRGGLTALNAVHLSDLKHMIGLPGSGKTTIIMLLLLWLDRHDYQTVVLLPSIETSLNMLGDLEFYGANVGLLVGQSPETRIRHANKLADRLGSDDSRGLGRTAPGAALLGLNCALAGFQTDEDQAASFPHLSPPCTSVLQKPLKADGSQRAQEKKHLCPLGGWCGRLKAPRELTQKRVWLGHVLSLDTRVHRHFFPDRVSHFELACRTADLIIVDEADGAQAVLDQRAISSLDLTGSVDSYEHALNRDLFVPMSAGRNDISQASIHNYSATASDFGKLNRALVAHIQRDLRRNKGATSPISRFKETFITGNNVLTELFCIDDISLLGPEERLQEERRFGAIQAFWDSCVHAALSNRTGFGEDEDVRDFNPQRVADAISKTPDEVEAAAEALTSLLRDWLAEPLLTRRDTILDKAREVTFDLIPPKESLSLEERNEIFRFLTGVTSLIMQFLSLLPVQQAMVAEGVHHSPLFKQGITEDLARVVPEALIGRLSGLRYHLDETGSGVSVRLQYVAFRGTPRALLYHLHHLLRHEGGSQGPAVLLASATSFLKQSPTYHIPTGPHLLLSPTTPSPAWQNSEYVFAPPPDPSRPERRLRFSGSPLEARPRILAQLIEYYLGGDDPLALRMCKEFDEGRKIGIVVNSYEQVRLAKKHLEKLPTRIAGRVIGIIDHPPQANDGTWITAAQAERLGMRDDWDVIIFPMKSLARGVNIVFEQGPRKRDAMLGLMIFLTRPHPAQESLDFVAGLVGASTLKFDMQQFSNPVTSIRDMAREWQKERRALAFMTKRILRFSVRASRLGALAEPFTADIMVDILQTIGRSMRNGCKTKVLFADAAWAPRSADGLEDDVGSSMLVQMRDILRACVHDPDPINRAIYEALYRPFLHPLEACQGLKTSNTKDMPYE